MKSIRATAMPVALLLLAAPALRGQGLNVDGRATFEGKPAVALSNGRLTVTVLKTGATIASIRLAGDDLNPLWQSFQDDRNNGRPIRNSGATGHFLCLDGFGPTSPEEREAGLEGHGEAHRLPWSTSALAVEGEEALLTQTVLLPRVHENVTRTVSLRSGENVVRVHSRLASLLSFDRPAVWAEHATIGSPFLERGATVVDLSPNRAKTRPRPKDPRGRRHRIVGDREFEWPLAPAAGGGTVDLRAAPLDDEGSLDHTGHLMTPGGEYAWVTALHPGKRLLLGYLFKTSEYPWLQTWEHYPAEGLMARGLEFGTQAYDRSRRETVTEGSMFGEPLYRWLPAESAIESTFLLFWTPTPEGFEGVDSVDFSGGKIRLTDKRSGRTVVLVTSQSL